MLVVTALVIGLTLFQVRFSTMRGVQPVQGLVLHGIVNLNLILLLLLSFLFIRNAVKLIFERRRGALGSKLRVKLVAAFLGLTLLPSLLLFAIAEAFLSGSLQYWFGVQVEDALRRSVEIAQDYYRGLEQEALYTGRSLVRALAVQGTDSKGLSEFLSRKRVAYGLDLIELYDSQGRARARCWAGAPYPGGEGLLRHALAGRPVARVESSGGMEFVQAAIPIPSQGGSGGALIIARRVPQPMRAKMAEVKAAYQGYGRLKLLKESLRRGHLLALVLVTLLIVFLGTWYGFYLSKGLVRPLQRLVEGTEEVARGHLDVYIEPSSDDEIGALVKSFNRMTAELKRKGQQLAAANADLRRLSQEEERRRRYMETVLSQVAAGVMALDQGGRITAFNPSAASLLGVSGALGRRLEEALPGEAFAPLREAIARAPVHGMLERRVRLFLPDRFLSLLVRASALRGRRGGDLGTVVVMEDLTGVQQAERAAAWKEVAQRIAHEIKNPLTPIKLSAERLRRRYLDRLSENGQVLDECTRTIISQVEQLRQMVNEFSNFARLPSHSPRPDDLNALAEEVLVLFREAHPGVRFSFQPDRSLPQLEIDREGMRRVLLNLLENAVDSLEGGRGEVELITRWEPQQGRALLIVADNGCGIPSQDRERIFEPYFSTKPSGTGLGLAIVRSIVSDHRGYVRVRDNLPSGTQLIVELPMGR